MSIDAVGNQCFWCPDCEVWKYPSKWWSGEMYCDCGQVLLEEKDEDQTRDA